MSVVVTLLFNLRAAAAAAALFLSTVYMLLVGAAVIRSALFSAQQQQRYIARMQIYTKEFSLSFAPYLAHKSRTSHFTPAAYDVLGGGKYHHDAAAEHQRDELSAAYSPVDCLWRTSSVIRIYINSIAATGRLCYERHKRSSSICRAHCADLITFPLHPSSTPLIWPPSPVGSRAHRLELIARL